MDTDKLPMLRQDRLLWQDTGKQPLPGSIVPCLLCCKPYVQSMYIGEADQLCPDCQRTYSDAARVICVRCNITIGRAVPKILDNGYYVRPRSILHSTACNICQPGLNSSTIVEIDEWQRTMRPSKLIVTTKG